MQRLGKAKKEIYEILEPDVSRKIATKIFTMFIMTLILLNVVSIIILSLPNISQKLRHILILFNVFSVIVFTIEYILRLWTCTINKGYKNPFYGRLKFALSPLLLIDFIAIFPFYLTFLIHIDLRFLRMLRLLRIFKMTRYSESFKIFGNIFKEKKEEIVISLVIVLLLMVLSSSLMYLAEYKAQPKVFSSIPATMWWAVITLTTVGYGDVVPITPIGRILGGVVALLGIAMFALPTGILASGFVEQIQKRRGKKAYLSTLWKRYQY